MNEWMNEKAQKCMCMPNVILTWSYLHLLKMKICKFLTTANLSYDQKCWHFSDHANFIPTSNNVPIVALYKG